MLAGKPEGPQPCEPAPNAAEVNRGRGLGLGKPGRPLYRNRSGRDAPQGAWLHCHAWRTLLKCSPHTGNVIGCRFLSAHPPGLCSARYLSGGFSYTRFTPSRHPHPTHFLSGTRYTARMTQRIGIGTPRHFTPSQRIRPPDHTPLGHACRPATGFPSTVHATAPSTHADGPCSAYGHRWHIAAGTRISASPLPHPQLIAAP